MSGTFCFMFSTTDVDYGAAFKGLAVPTLSHDGIQWAVGSLGAILMPYNLYLHSALVLSRWVGSDASKGAVPPAILHPAACCLRLPPLATTLLRLVPWYARCCRRSKHTERMGVARAMWMVRIESAVALFVALWLNFFIISGLCDCSPVVSLRGLLAAL